MVYLVKVKTRARTTADQWDGSGGASRVSRLRSPSDGCGCVPVRAT